MAHSSIEGEGENTQSMSDVFGPGHVDASLRQTLQILWAILPADKKNIHGVEAELRRLVDRALRDFREDAEHFGIS